VTCDQSTAKVEAEKKAFQGNWESKELFRDNKISPAFAAWSFSSDESGVVDGFANPAEFHYRLDPQAMPGKIDFYFPKLMRGICRFTDSGHLLIATSDSEDGPRPGPEAFEPQGTSHASLSELKRVPGASDR